MADGTNCPNCGAPMKNGNCEYCGTEKPLPGDNCQSYLEITADCIRIGVIPANYNKSKIVEGIYT